eukprot:140781-Alexandrium_andersonii.AAC.1
MRASRPLQVQVLTVSHEEGVGERPARSDREHVGVREASAEALGAGLRLVDRGRAPPAGQASSGGIPARRGKPAVEP